MIEPSSLSGPNSVADIAGSDRMAALAAAHHVQEFDPELSGLITRAAEATGITLPVALCAAFAQMVGRLLSETEILLKTSSSASGADDLRRVFALDLAPSNGGPGLLVQVSEALDGGTPAESPTDPSMRTICFAFGETALAPAMTPPDEPSLHVTPLSGSLRLELSGGSGVTAEAAARWSDHYRALLAAFAADPLAPMSDLSLLSPEEAATIARLGNGTEVAPLTAVRLEELIAHTVDAMPDAVAIEAEDGDVTFAALARASDRLAAHIQELLPRPGGRVAVLIERSSLLPISLLAILKAGHAFVPLDPTHPEPRLRSILESADVQGILYSGDLPEAARQLPALAIRADVDLADRAPAPVGSIDPTAYVIFTSGSTGTPKGVEVPHRALVNFIVSMADVPGFTASDTLLAVTTVCFDIAMLEIFLPLIAGGKVVICSARPMHIAFAAVERLARGDITVLQGTPTLFRMLLEARWKPGRGLKLLIGGEPLPRDLADRLLEDGAEVWNMYGPTETTVWSSCSRVGSGPIHIGRPIANTDLHVLDGAGQIAPIGAEGELNIGGLGLAKGYFRRPDLTARAFREVRLAGNGRRRLYATGDLAIREPDASIRLLGRRDGQVKLRGFRIELGEVETAIRAVPGVRAAAADVRPGELGPILVGYVVPSAGNDPSPAELTAALGRTLPSYMVPTRWTKLPALPLTMNGKLDRRRLP